MARGIRRYGLISLKGMAMGAADVVPGVSGGTIAFISGIYQELIDSIRSIDHKAVRTLFRQGLPSFWKQINGNFLLALALGIIISVVSLSKGLLWLLESYPPLVWSFFFGLIIASAIYVFSTIGKRTAGVWLMSLLGAVVAAGISLASPAQGPEALWYVFLVGAIAICAMILPGVSGSFLLLLMGMYEYILGSLHELYIPVILVFMAGAATGLISFSHLLSWLLRRYHDLTVALLSGFMVGSLIKVWPWKVPTETLIVDGEIKVLQERHVGPSAYEALSREPAYLWGGIGLMLFALVLIYSLERIGGKQNKLI